MRSLLLTLTISICIYNTSHSQSTCALATLLTPGTQQCGTNFFAGSFPDGGGAPNNPCNASYNDGEYWFQFTGTGDPLQLDASGLTSTWAGMYVLDACPGVGSCIASDENGGSTADLVITTPNLTLGVTYYIVIANWSAPYSTGFCLDATVIIPIPGESCATPLALTPGTQQCATNSYVGSFPDDFSAPTNPCSGTNNDGEFWFNYTGTGNALQLDLTGLTGAGSGIFVMDACPGAGACIASALESGTADYSLTTPNLTLGNPYFIVIANSAFVGAYQTDFCLDATEITPPANDDCGSATVVTPNGTATCASETAGTILGATASGEAMDGCGGTANDDVWFTFDANATEMSINLNNVAGSNTDLYHSVYSGSCGALGGTSIVCSDPHGSAVTGLTIGNTYLVRVYSQTAFSETSTFDVCLFPTPPAPTNTTCNTMSPICSGTPIIFSAQSTGSSAPVGNNYGCLSTQPDPTWFYMEIATPGLFSVDITAGEDVDYAAWGPYADLATSKAACGSFPAPIDCSYDSSPIEQLNIPGTVAGEYYVLLVTNYAGKQQSITVDQSASAIATSNCAILALPVGLELFDATLNKDKATVDVNWTTNSERDNSFFTILRSKDGKVWETVGITKGADNSTETINYSFEDKNPYLGVSYYKLKQTDKNGSSTTTSARTVKNIPGTEFKLYPQPVENELNFDAGDAPIDAIKITDITGKEIVFDYQLEGNNYKLNLSHLTSGIYNIIITTGDEKVSQRVVKL